MAVDTSVRAAPAVRRALVRTLVVPSWVAVALTLSVVAAGTALPPAVRYAPLAASAVLFGLPHGAVDHLATARVRGEAPTARSVGRVVALYLALGGAYAAAWFLAPVAAAAAFVLVTWFHWGQGDLYSLSALTGDGHLRTRAQRGLAVVVRGGLPMLVPLVAFPGRYRAVVSEFVARFGTAGVPGWVFAPPVRLGAGAAFGAVAVGTLAVGYRRARRAGGNARRAWAVDAAETGLLGAYFLLVPPVLAVGVYFCLWHSTRHVARLLAVDGRARDALDRAQVGAALGRFARDAAPLTAASVGLLVGLYAVVPDPPAPTDVPGLVALYLVLVAVLTVPHVVVVSVMDREQGVWRPA